MLSAFCSLANRPLSQHALSRAVKLGQQSVRQLEMAGTHLGLVGNSLCEWVKSIRLVFWTFLKKNENDILNLVVLRLEIMDHYLGNNMSQASIYGESVLDSSTQNIK